MKLHQNLCSIRFKAV